MDLTFSSLWEGIARAVAGLDQACGALARTNPTAQTREARSLLASAAQLLGDAKDALTREDEEAPAPEAAPAPAPSPIVVIENPKGAAGKEFPPAEPHAFDVRAAAYDRWLASKLKVASYLAAAQLAIEQEDGAVAAAWAALARTRIEYAGMEVAVAGTEAAIEWEAGCAEVAEVETRALTLKERAAAKKGGAS